MEDDRKQGGGEKGDGEITGLQSRSDAKTFDLYSKRKCGR